MVKMSELIVVLTKIIGSIYDVPKHKINPETSKPRSPIMLANIIPFPAMQHNMLKKISMNPSPYLFRDTIEQGPTFGRNTLGPLAHYCPFNLHPIF